MQETLPSDSGHDQARRHIVWVLLGTRMIRCSVYSVRPLSEYERVLAEVQQPPTMQEDLSKLLPEKTYEDISGDIPGEDETEIEMPLEPPAGGLKRDYEEDEIEERREAPDFQPERRITKKRPVSHIVPRVPANPEPEALDEDMACLNYFADTGGPACSDMAGSAMELLMKAEDLDADVLFWEIDLLTDADWDEFFLQPEAFLVAKMRASEVGYDKLTVVDKSLFNEAMPRELGQYLQ
jgi:hypothetical protein